MRAIRRGELADRAFSHLVGSLPARDRPWLHELVYGTLRLRGRLDFILDRYLKRGTASLDADVLDILRLGMYQLIEMDSVPSYAAVSQSVELARTLRRRGASSLVNGVLQSIRRTQATLQPRALDSADALVHWGSHPRWLIDRWVARFGVDQAARLVAANNARPQLYVRPIGITAEETVERAAEIGAVLQKVAGAPDALEVVAGRVQDLVAALPVVVQDPAAGLVVRYAAIERGVVADLCAAPGGKALAMADSVGKRGIVVASDLSASRLDRLIDNLRRISESPSLPVSLSLVHHVADARRPAVESVDAVLLDAPCTGTGTFRRHPDGKWRITSDDLRALVQLQSEMLNAAGRIVKVGGILIYATCSLEPEENQQQVTSFLEQNPNFVRRPPGAWHAPDLIDGAGNLNVLPQSTGFDGAFAARLERVA